MELEDDEVTEAVVVGDEVVMEVEAAALEVMVVVELEVVMVLEAAAPAEAWLLTDAGSVVPIP